MQQAADNLPDQGMSAKTEDQKGKEANTL